MLGFALVVALTSLGGGVARADGYAGSWREGPKRIEVRVGAWPAACGPRPEATSAASGREARVEVRGDHLTIRGSRTRRTDGCWSDNHALRRAFASYEAGRWTSLCRTPAGEARAETGEYTLRATTNDSLEFRGTTELAWTIEGARCTATLIETQSFERVSTFPTTPIDAGTDAGRAEVVAPILPPPTTGTGPPPTRTNTGTPHAEVVDVRGLVASRDDLRPRDPRGAIREPASREGGAGSESQIVAKTDPRRGSTAQLAAAAIVAVLALCFLGIWIALRRREAAMLSRRPRGRDVPIRRGRAGGGPAPLEPHGASPAEPTRPRPAAAAARRCPICGDLFPDTLRYCPKDGVELPPAD